jgi:hypothetical protein
MAIFAKQLSFDSPLFILLHKEASLIFDDIIAKQLSLSFSLDNPGHRAD